MWKLFSKKVTDKNMVNPIEVYSRDNLLYSIYSSEHNLNIDSNIEEFEKLEFNELLNEFMFLCLNNLSFRLISHELNCFLLKKRKITNNLFIQCGSKHNIVGLTYNDILFEICTGEPITVDVNKTMLFYMERDGYIKFETDNKDIQREIMLNLIKFFKYLIKIKDDFDVKFNKHLEKKNRIKKSNLDKRIKNDINVFNKMIESLV